MTLQLPLTLKKQLVDDWDYVTQQKKVTGFSLFIFLSSLLSSSSKIFKCSNFLYVLEFATIAAGEASSEPER